MEEEQAESTLQFHDMELDERLLKAIAKLGWTEPSAIQEAAIPLMLEGRDVLIKARTGSGKTGAFAIPIIQKILNAKQGATEQAIRALVLAPFRELCKQINANIAQLTCKCSKDVKSMDVSQWDTGEAQRSLISIQQPDIIVATPAKALMHLKNKNMVLDQLEILIIDEADHILSSGYEEDLKAVLKYLPKVHQSALASATLSDDVTELKRLALRRPAVLKLEEPEMAPASQLTHYHIGAEEEEKAVILYVLLKLHLVRGKTIVFVNTVDRCYKLKLYLEQFNIPTCVLNSELPAAARCHSVAQFNEGLYDIIIASDEKNLEQPDEAPSTSKGKKGTRKKDKEAGVSRGIDFQFVSNVINFDFPKDIKPYIHRVGRTARGKNKGTALSFVSINERPLMEKVEEYLRGGSNETVIKAFQFKMEEVEGFRYRARDAWRAVTRIAVREARLKEIKQEIFNCEKLKTFFEDNPKDLQSLRHDKALHVVKKMPHMADVPEYLVPPTLKRLAGISSRRRKWRSDDAKGSGRQKPAEAKFQAKRRNPLLSMEFSGFSKKTKK
ncbi:probable ATP-dependent RNA helicase DDX56 [Neocloeon triangulifer]|uniref:probable ATP-dependent RNA helicase DDX56 n=1 Tax=Neocloeon triangulifer TaxID=2078957 RepID=UPI00286F09AC|nr:probable ATP-dependent RNA helicase DDX56 [Neocloeon triangulifer]